MGDEVMKTAIPMRCRAVHSVGRTNNDADPDAFVPYDNNNPNNFINSVSRGELNTTLLNAADKVPSITTIFDSKVTKIEADNTVWFGERSVKASLVIGCDGAYSGTRDAMLRLLKVGNRFQRHYISHGYKELTIPPTKDGSFTMTLFAPFLTEKDDSTGEDVPGMLDVKTDAEITSYFEKYFPDLMSVMPNYLQEWSNPASQLVSILVRPWNYQDKIVLLGDAAHACVPFYGQGMNCAFEDALVFCEILEKNNHDLSATVPEFAAVREKDGEAISQLSMRNYQTMSDHSGSTLFRIRKRFEGALSWMLPNYWIPEYKMVAFTRIPYSEAIARTVAQDWALTYGVFYYAAAGSALAGLAYNFRAKLF